MAKANSAVLEKTREEAVSSVSPEAIAAMSLGAETPSEVEAAKEGEPKEGEPKERKSNKLFNLSYFKEGGLFRVGSINKMIKEDKYGRRRMFMVIKVAQIPKQFVGDVWMLDVTEAQF